MLDEVREVVGAALIATGHAPNDATPAALGAARSSARCSAPSVARYDSDDFCGPVAAGRSTSITPGAGRPRTPSAPTPAPALRRACTRARSIWITAAAIPAGAPDSVASTALLRELMEPELASLTTLRSGFASPNEAARRRLPTDLRNDENLFPSTETLARCHALHDLGGKRGTASCRVAVRR